MAAAMQPSVQRSQQPSRRRGPGKPFRRGESGNPRGSRLVIEKRAEMLADFERECGCLIVGTDRIIAERGIEMLTRRPRNHDEAVRLLNAGTRVIDRLRAKYAKREASRDKPVLAKIPTAPDPEPEEAWDLWVNEGNGLLRNRAGEVLTETEYKTKYPNSEMITLNVFGDRSDRKKALARR